MLVELVRPRNWLSAWPEPYGEDGTGLCLNKWEMEWNEGRKNHLEEVAWIS